MNPIHPANPTTLATSSHPVTPLHPVKQFVLASHNRKKLVELETILEELGIAVTLLPDDAPVPEETGATFAENALLKAQAAARLTGLPALADDSGLCVDALADAPGIYSARYGSTEYYRRMGMDSPATPILRDPATDAQRNAYLLGQMAKVPDGRRQARFVCVIACVLEPGDVSDTVSGYVPPATSSSSVAPHPTAMPFFTVRGECEGVIAREPHGDEGFGYDPIFYVPAHRCTFGELPAAVKNQISHRARALQALAEVLRYQLPS